ncbi:SusC/RagA family TonB-linked outer membrane protein [Niabella aurantiaca]|uniref:SusC/RagA family TonB-linked outer membrane protein n=1 Tax=Niabella aurantiaca TaxID=379900 RepID=UPI0003A4DF9C|nr:TonB-dependent receptor [Niabella aurantiaca]
MKYRSEKPSRHVLQKTGPLLFFLLFCFATVLNAQKGTAITGNVSDDKGVPLRGVSVSVKGTTTATLTSEQGTYHITAPAGATLVFTSVGYTSEEVRVGDQPKIDVTLRSAATDLNEVVVVGYGTQLKKDLTGAVSVVKAADVNKRQATTVAEALQGLATGIKVRGGGRPGSEAQIQIRGLKNISNSNPLYVIDGLITTANRDFNPEDIESIQILKDASAAAIYGSRAANGVIIITTKKGKSGPMRIDASAKYSVQTMPRYKLAETDEFKRLNYMAYDNANVPRQQLDTMVNTNWQDEAFRQGNIRDLNLSFSGGGNNGSYFVSGGYFGNKGTVISTGFDRYNLRVNTQGTKGIFSIGENLAISNAKTDEMGGNPVIDVIRLLPTIPVYDDTHPGGYGYGDERKARTFGTNPVAIADLINETNENLRLRGNLWSELKPFDFLTYRLNLGYETSRDHYKYFRKLGNWTLNQPYDPAIANENRAESVTKLIENTLTFKKEFAKHDLTVIAGQSFQRDDYAQIWGSKRNVLQDASGHYYDVLDQGNEAQLGGFRERVALISYFGRVEYAFDDRYLINGIVRSDGSSRLGTDLEWEQFPSVSAGWRISKEKFFKADWINDLKVRANYGTLGSSNIGPYEPDAVINTLPTIAIGKDQHTAPTAIQVQLTNPYLVWEKLQQQNYGFDATLLDNRLSFTAEYYIAQTQKVLYRSPLLYSSGHDGLAPFVNAVSLENKGFEFTIAYRNSIHDFNYNAALNVTTVRNKVLELAYGKNELYVGNTVTRLGQPIGMWYVLQTNGLFQSQDEVANYKNAEGKVIQPDAKPGDIRFVDNNGDGQITNDDKAIVGSPWPKLETGLNLGASYKNFEITMDWFGSFGSKVFNGPRSVTDRFDDNSNYRAGIQPWTPENPNTDMPRVLYASTLNARGDTERWLENGNFFRLKLINLSYRLSDAFVKKIGFEHAQVSVSGQNLLTFTPYSGLDPEFSNTSIFEKGYDFGAYPNVRMVTFGLNFGF